MGNPNLMTLATTDPMWLAVVRKNERAYSIFRMPMISGVIGLHKSYLESAMLIFGDTEKAVQKGVNDRFPSYRKDILLREGSLGSGRFA